ncbi:MAG: HWE histidine kinase domain-containing protein [Rhodoblastus sp.]
MGLAIWRYIPGLKNEPTHSELVAANDALRAERDARQAAVQELSLARDELERRVEERTSALELARRRFETALQGTGIVVAHQDCDLRYTWMYNAPEPLTGRDVVGRLPQDVLPTDLAELQAKVKNKVIETHAPMKFDAVYPAPNGPIWYEGRVEPLIVDGKLEGVMTVSIDVTRHVLHERQMCEVMRELTHRSKNLLAVVQGMARQSSTGVSDVRVFIDGFGARLEALSRAHEMLIDSKWRGVSLRAVLERELLPLASGLHTVRIEGPDIQLSPEAVQNFSLAVNELSSDLREAPPDTPVDVVVAWVIEGGLLQFDWRRSGGHGASIDGFGHNLLNRVLPRQIGGQAQLAHSQDVWAYALKGDASLLAPIGRRMLEESGWQGGEAATGEAMWRPRQTRNTPAGPTS